MQDLKKKKLTQKRLKELLKYDGETGRWYRRVGIGGNVQGSIAGTLDMSTGYNRLSVDYKIYYSARLAILYIDGYMPENQVDHKNRIRDDDRWENIREASRQCQQRNHGLHKNNVTGVNGVSWSMRAKKWRGYITIGNKQIHLGFFKEFVDAVKARWEAEKKNGWPNCNSSSSAYLYLKKHLQSGYLTHSWRN